MSEDRPEYRVPPFDDGDETPREDPPKGSSRKAFLVRLSPELHAELKRWADGELRSLNAHIEYLLRDAVRRRRGDD